MNYNRHTITAKNKLQLFISFNSLHLALYLFSLPSVTPPIEKFSRIFAVDWFWIKIR